MSGYTSLPSRPGTLPAWPASTPLDAGGHLIYYKKAGEGYEAYELPVGRLGAGVLNKTTATVVAGGGTTAGTYTVTFTSATTGARDVAVNLTASTAAAAATAIAAALNQVAAIADNYVVAANSADVVITARLLNAEDTSINLALPGANGITADASSTRSFGALVVADVAQVETATVDSTGDLGAVGPATTNVTITSALFASPVVVGVALTSAQNTNDKVADAIRTALGINATVSAQFVVSGATDKVILTAKTAAANDSTLNIAIAGGNGIIAAASSANTIPGAYATRPLYLGQTAISGTAVLVNTATATNAVAWTQVS